MSRTAAGRSAVTPRAILIGLAVMAVNTYWVTVVEVRWYSLDGSCLPLFVTPVFLLFALVLVNLALARLSPGAALSQTELLTIYLMTVISETLAGHDFVQNLFGAIGHPHWFASAENDWENLFHADLPTWLTVSDPIALTGFYEGGASFLWPEMVRPFLVPLAAWGGFLFVLIGVMLGINILLRRHWTENEKLSYPLVALPVELTAGPGRPGLLSDKIMWMGFALAVVVDVMNGLHTLVPAVPAVPGVKLTNVRFTSPPWSGAYRVQAGVYPFAVALAFFIPSDLSFSCWFFFVLAQLQLVLCEWLGVRQAPPTGFPHLASQAAGGWIAIALGALLTTRGHLRRVWRQVWNRQTSAEAEAAARSYRVALAGVAVGLLLLAVFLNVAGMGVPVTVAFLGIFFTLSVAITRVRAQFGTPHEIYYVNPHRLIADVAGIHVLPAAEWTALSTTYWFNRGYRCHPMPCQLEGFKMAELAGMELRALMKAMLLATLAAVILSYWANLQVTFREGAAAKCQGFKSWVGRETYDRLALWLKNLPEPNYPAVGAMAAGAVVFFGLRWLHFRYTSLPLHPAGYPLATSFAMNYFWVSFLVGWLVKTTVLRYAGREGHRVAFRFFLGLLLGDYVIGSLWAIIGPAYGVLTYKIFI